MVPLSGDEVKSYLPIWFSKDAIAVTSECYINELEIHNLEKKISLPSNKNIDSSSTWKKSKKRK